MVVTTTATLSAIPGRNRVGHFVAAHFTVAQDGFMQRNGKAVVAAVGVLAAAIISLLTSLGAVHWSAAQISVVSVETTAAIGFITAIVAHYWPGTKAQPVAVAGTFTALVTATLTLGTGFVWWHLTQAKVSALVAVVSGVIGVGSALLAHTQVTAGTSPTE